MVGCRRTVRCQPLEHGLASRVHAAGNCCSPHGSLLAPRPLLPCPLPSALCTPSSPPLCGCTWAARLPLPRTVGGVALCAPPSPCFQPAHVSVQLVCVAVCTVLFLVVARACAPDESLTFAETAKLFCKGFVVALCIECAMATVTNCRTPRGKQHRFINLQFWRPGVQSQALWAQLRCGNTCLPSGHSGAESVFFLAFPSLWGCWCSRGPPRSCGPASLSLCS